MKFSTEKKSSIMMYLLEKIEQKDSNISKNVADKCGLSRNTVNQYLKELQEEKIIRKIKRGSYELVSESFEHLLQADKGELSSDTYAFDKFFKQHIEGCTEQARRIWQYGFSEMANNVMDHSGAKSLYLKIVKSYLTTKVVLADDGVGIFNKIKDHFGFESLDEARCELFKGKLTTDKENHSGEGIFFTSKMMDYFLILSSGKVFKTDKYEREINIDVKAEWLKGTAVYMELSNFTRRSISEVFNQYSSVDGGFTKTKIPMKNIFDSAPVSRSQAKRVCNRLDQFSEIVLDFEGIDWMGQAFAHQLFVVYQNAHPDMLLKPINMCPEVEKMYTHVVKTK